MLVPPFNEKHTDAVLVTDWFVLPVNGEEVDRNSGHSDDHADQCLERLGVDRKDHQKETDDKEQNGKHDIDLERKI